MNLRLIAIEIGDLLKYDAVVNDINRKGAAIFHFPKEEFPNPDITSVRAKAIYDWIMTLGKQSMEQSRRSEALVSFCRAIAPEGHRQEVNKILERSGLSPGAAKKEGLDEFLVRNFHEEIHKHSKDLFCQGHFFHAVFEACKAYNKLVQGKARSTKDGQSLMLEVWGPEGVLKITKCQTETDRNVQNGVKFLAAGLMQAIRNPTAHEPALDWPINKQDCLDLLSFLSFLFRQLDVAVYYKQ
uniref:TIGR02391 family protein n=1 Tax=Geobacter metallireducens TaxID=28232 RepID=A0A831U311_GEOME